MIKKFLIFCVITMLLVVVGCSSKTSNPKFNIPNEFDYATDFVSQLNKNGVNVQEVKKSTYEGFFKESNKAAFVETDKGVIDVVFFPDHDADKIKIQPVKDDASRYKYNIQGKPTAGNGIIDANRSLYFSVHGNFFSVTDSKELDDAIKKTYRH